MSLGQVFFLFVAVAAIGAVVAIYSFSRAFRNPSAYSGTPLRFVVLHMVFGLVAYISGFGTVVIGIMWLWKTYM